MDSEKGIDSEKAKGSLDKVVILGIAVIMGGGFFWEITNNSQINKISAYTVKVVDEKGNTTVLYKDKTVEIEKGVIYVCPLKQARFLPCTDDKEAIKLTGNFIIEKQP